MKKLKAKLLSVHLLITQKAIDKNKETTKSNKESPFFELSQLLHCIEKCFIKKFQKTYLPFKYYKHLAI